jgi:hypothetical protein
VRLRRASACVDHRVDGRGTVAIGPSYTASAVTSETLPREPWPVRRSRPSLGVSATFFSAADRHLPLEVVDRAGTQACELGYLVDVLTLGELTNGIGVRRPPSSLVSGTGTVPGLRREMAPTVGCVVT